MVDIESRCATISSAAQRLFKWKEDGNAFGNSNRESSQNNNVDMFEQTKTLWTTGKYNDQLQMFLVAVPKGWNRRGERITLFFENVL